MCSLKPRVQFEIILGTTTRAANPPWVVTLIRYTKEDEKLMYLFTGHPNKLRTWAERIHVLIFSGTQSAMSSDMVGQNSWSNCCFFLSFTLFLACQWIVICSCLVGVCVLLQILFRKGALCRTMKTIERQLQNAKILNSFGWKKNCLKNDFVCRHTLRC